MFDRQLYCVGDVIYDVELHRQERIKVLGYRTADWNGSLNIPGFIFDDAKITEWKAWQDYAIGDVVKYKEFYYTAKIKLGTAIFEDDSWTRLEGPSPDYLLMITRQPVCRFYDLDSDNFDPEQQKLAQHPIG